MSSFAWERALDPDNKLTCWDIHLSEEQFNDYQDKGYVIKNKDLYILDHPGYPQSIIHVYRNL